MNFNFPLLGDVKSIIGKLEQSYFEKAKNFDGKYKNEVHIHREWIRDVIAVFARKSELPIIQATQLVQRGDFSYALPMHRRHKVKTPETIKVLGKDEINPVWERLKGLSDMAPHDHRGFMRDSFVFALSLRHPLKKVTGQGFTDDTAQRLQRNLNQTKHRDETHIAHRERMAKVLTALSTGDQVGAHLIAAGMIPESQEEHEARMR